MKPTGRFLGEDMLHGFITHELPLPFQYVLFVDHFKFVSILDKAPSEHSSHSLS